jgi:hypothetical protein
MYNEWFYVTSDEGAPRGTGWEVHASICDRTTREPVGHPIVGYGETRTDAKEEAEAQRPPPGAAHARTQAPALHLTARSRLIRPASWWR